MNTTVLTGGTTFMVLVVLFVMGGGVIHAFAARESAAVSR